MRKVVRIDSHEFGPRLYVCGRRCHHGLLGVAFVTVGVALIVHDWHDRPVWWWDAVRVTPYSHARAGWHPTAVCA